MKRIAITISLLFMIVVQATQAQTDGPQPETFQMEWRDSTVTMQKYFVVFLKSGPARSQSQEEAAEIQQKHLDYISKMYDGGHVSMTGPMGDGGDIRGIAVYNTATLEQARNLAEQDPAVKAGRLVVEVHPWWAAKGSKLN